MRRLAAVPPLLVALLASPLVGQAVPDVVHDPEIAIIVPETPVVVPHPPAYYAQQNERLLLWYHGLKEREFTVELPRFSLFEPRILIRHMLGRINMVSTRYPPHEPPPPPAHIDTVFGYDLHLYGPKDRTLVQAYMHLRPPGSSIGFGPSENRTVWTASFRYAPDSPAPGADEIVSTYTFDFTQLRSPDFTFVGPGLKTPHYWDALRPIGAPTCPQREQEEFFADAPPFRLGICVHEAERTDARSIGSTDYSIIVHHDRAWRWKELRRRDAPRDDAKPVSNENPIVPAEIYDVTFTDAEGKAVTVTLDFRRLWHWNESRTLFLSQFGIRELRWVGDLDGPVLAP